MKNIITIITLLLTYSLLLATEQELEKFTLKSSQKSLQPLHDELIPEQNVETQEEQKVNEQEEVNLQEIEETSHAFHQTKNLIHHQSLALITEDSPLIEQGYDLQNALIMHQRLCDLHSSCQEESFVQKLIPYSITTGILTTGYYFLTSAQTKKIRSSLPITPFIAIGASVGMLMYLRHWLNEDKFKALDHLKEASNLAIKTAQELTLIKMQLYNVEKMNKELIKKIEPCEKRIKEILTDMEKITKISDQTVKIAELQEYTLKLAIYNGQKYNHLVHKLIQQSEQHEFLITELEESNPGPSEESTQRPIAGKKSEQHEFLITKLEESNPGPSEESTQRPIAGKKNETPSRTFNQAEIDQQKIIVDAYCKKHSLNILKIAIIKDLKKKSISHAYYGVPQEWRQRHYKEFDDSLEESST